MATRITNDPQGFAVPSWSTSGDALFAHGGGTIYRMRPDGTGIERLFEGVDPAPAVDGQRLLVELQFSTERRR